MYHHILVVLCLYKLNQLQKKIVARDCCCKMRKNLCGKQLSIRFTNSNKSRVHYLVLKEVLETLPDAYRHLVKSNFLSSSRENPLWSCCMSKTWSAVKIAPDSNNSNDYSIIVNGEKEQVKNNRTNTKKKIHFQMYALLWASFEER